MTLLQEIEDGASGEMRLGTLLRKCLVLASRLGSKPVTDWIRWELDGYPKDVEVPAYRKMSLSVRVNMQDIARRVEGWVVPSALLGERADECTKMDCRSGVGEIEHLLQGNPATVSFDMDNLLLYLAQRKFTHMNIISAWGEVGSNQYKHVLETVRTRVLQFALDLEKEYPNAGAERSTAPKDADRVNQIFHNNIYGPATVVGTANHSNVMLNVTQGDFASLQQTLSEHGVPREDFEELKCALEAEPAPSADGFGPRVAGWIGTMVKKAAEGTWKVATSAAAAVLTKALQKYYGL